MATDSPTSEDSLEQLSGTVAAVRYHDNDSYFSVVRLDPDSGDPVTVVGELVDPTPGQRITVHGHWTRHERYGRQFELEYARVEPPESAEGVRQYLTEFVPGVGPALAERIVERFGTETFRVIENTPERLREVEGIGAVKAESIRESWAAAEGTREVMAALAEHGISQAYAIRIFDEYGDRAIAVLRQDPYRLARDVRGIGFKQADRIARDAGVDPDDPARWAAVARYVLEGAEQEGHCFLPRTELVDGIREETGGDTDRARRTLRRLIRRDELIMDREIVEGNDEAIYRPPMYHAERRVAEGLCGLHTSREGTRAEPIQTGEHPPVDGFEFNRRQKRAIGRVREGGVMILTGGPGTGKTTTVLGMIELLEETGRSVRLAAPTGRAAKRLSESTDRSATTLHRLLQYSPHEGFGRNEDDPLDVDVVIVDETSMVDVYLMNQLLSALPEGAGLVLVGDADQLPSVGPGTVFSDCIDADRLPVVKLTEIYRQGRESGIVQNAHRINRGKVPRSGYHDFYYEEMEDEEAEDFLVEVASRRMPDKTGLDPRTQIQVIAPMYDRAAGVNRFNQRLQQRLTSESDETPAGYRIGDKVMQTTNNYEKDVFNGNVGFVTGYRDTDDQLVVRYPDTEAEVRYGARERRRELTLAYAITVHKSQGSEYPAVLMPVARGHSFLLNRPLLYTAVTRAERYVVLAGPRRTLHLAVGREETRKRWTGLVHRLRGAFEGIR